MMHGRKSQVSFMILGLFLLGVLGGCGGGPSSVARTNFVAFTPEELAEIEANSSDEYRIQEGDILKVAFNFQRDLTQQDVVVLSDGSISLMGVDRLELGGLTVSEADRMVTEAYSKDYLDPNLSIIIQQSQGRKVYVLGEVKSPGVHQLPAGGIDMLGAISVAGGFTDHAARSGAVLVRVTDEGYMAQEINLDDFSSLSSVGLALIKVEPFDVIYIPRSRIGDFAYFSKTILAGMVQITRIASDIKYLSTGGFIRF